MRSDSVLSTVHFTLCGGPSPPFCIVCDSEADWVVTIIRGGDSDVLKAFRVPFYWLTPWIEKSSLW